MRFTLLLLFFASAFAHQLTFLATDGDKTPEEQARCLALRCPLPLIQCQMQSQCRQCTQCMQQCPQNDLVCPTWCFFKYADGTFNRMTQCGVDRQCLPNMTWSNTTCPGKIPQRVSTFDVRWLAEAADMVVLRGSHPVYDCLPCQRLQFNYVNDTLDKDHGGVRTRWSTSLDGVVRDATYVLHQDEANTLLTKYSLFGMPVEEHYFVLDYTEDGRYMLYFYCGFGFGGQYQGALVYGRLSSAFLGLPKEVEVRFSRALERAGLQKYVPQLGAFCRPSYSGNCGNF
jgi:hypothetical protein